jgi:hypothetical protein
VTLPKADRWADLVEEELRRFAHANSRGGTRT